MDLPFVERKVVFLDRDGVIIDNSKHYYVYNVEDVKFVDEIFNNLKLLINHGFELVIITNQSGIATSVYTHFQADKVNEFIKSAFQQHGISVTAIYYCPHHPTVGKCLCRKPQSLLIEKAIARFRFSIEKSFLIGDSDSDVESAKRVGVKAFKSISNLSIFEICEKIFKEN